MRAEPPLTLPDGRELAWATAGPPGGAPVLFLAGAASGKSMAFGLDRLTAHGLRLVTVDRPGMGGSTHDPGRTLASTTDDLRRLVDHLGGPVPVVANSQGAVFGVALAAAGAASRLHLVAPADEVAHPRVAARLPEPFAALVRQVEHDREAAEAALSGMDAAAMERMVLDGADAGDRAVYTDPGFAARYRAALAEGFAGGGYVTDTLIAMSPWALDWEAVAVPVTLWFGARDHGHSPDQGVFLAERLRGERRVVEDAGGALLWTHAAAIMDAIGADAHCSRPGTLRPEMSGETPPPTTRLAAPSELDPRE